MSKNLLLVQPMAVNSIVPPNVALGRLSNFFKNLNWRVDYITTNESMYDWDKQVFNIDGSNYDRVIISQVFTFTNCRVFGCDDVIVGGGASPYPQKNLPQEMEKLPVDYSIFDPYWDNHVFGSITKGCPRNCYFCDVPKIEGNIHFNKSIDDILQNRDVEFQHLSDPFLLVAQDSNFLAWSGCIRAMDELIERDLKTCFMCANDIRLMTAEKAERLSKMNLSPEIELSNRPGRYVAKYHPRLLFAFDDIRYLKLIESGFNIMRRYADPINYGYFVFYDDRSPTGLEEFLQRITWCYDKGGKPLLSNSLRFKYPISHPTDPSKKAFVNFFTDPFAKGVEDHHYTEFAELLCFVFRFGSEEVFDSIQSGRFSWKNNGTSKIRQWANYVEYLNRDKYLKMLNM